MTHDHRICPVCGGSLAKGCYTGCAVDVASKLRAEVEKQRKLIAEWIEASDDVAGVISRAMVERENLQAENEKLRKVLEAIRDRRNGDRQTVSPPLAFAAFNRLNAEMLAIFAECDAALEEDKQNGH